MDNSTELSDYLIIGNGAMAKHFMHYLGLININYTQWSRSQPYENLPPLLKSAHQVLFLIKDDAIDPFIENYCLKYKTKHQYYIHFSGSLRSEYAYTAHPLQTFSGDFYPPESYLDIPFGIENNGPDFTSLLPGLKNRHFKINYNDKPYYHALSSIANNFTTLIWQKYFNELKNHFNIDPALAIPFLEQTLTNLKNDYTNALTGPIERHDLKTIETHLKALANDNFLNIYQAFVDTHLKEFSKDGKKNECA